MRTLIILVATVLLVTGCEKTHDLNQDSNSEAKVKSEAIISLQGDDHADYSKLTVSSSNGNQLVINKSIVENSAEAANFKVGNTITAFTSPKDALIGKILSIKEEGNSYVVEIEQESIASLFESLDVDLSLNQLGENGSETKSDSHTGGIVYPVRIIGQNENGEDVIYSNTPATRASWDNSFEYPFSFSIPLSSDKQSAISVTNGFVESKITTILNVQISWFKLKKFEVSMQGYINANAPVNVKFNLDKEYAFDKEFKTTINTEKYWAVYKIAGIPMVVQFTPSVKFSGFVKANASADLNIDLGMNTEFNAGACYTGSWSKVASAKPEFKFEVSGVSSPLQVQSRIGIVPSVELNLLGILLGETELDSYATADINAYVKTPADNNKGELGVSLKASAYVAGFVDLGLKAFNNPNTYKKEFNIYGPKEFLNLSWTVPYNNVGQ